MRSSIAILVTAAALAGFGCGESRQEKFEKAMKAADAARTTLDSARKEYAEQEAETEKARAAAADAESELAEAQHKLDAATTGFESARGEVAKWADDASVSRLLQQKLLEEPALANTAVSARVESGVALLEGTAPDTEAAARAVASAGETPGVVEVRNAIGVPSVATAPPAAPAPAETMEPPAEALPMEPAPEAPAP
jgi:osmotically-inducible protein OsmY